MDYKRRSFLKTAAAASAGSLLLPSWACQSDQAQQGKPDEQSTPVATTKGSLDAYGIQLYTLREDMPKDPIGVLSKIAQYGYKQIEGYEGDQGMFWNVSHTEFKNYLDDLGLSMVASHCNINENFEEKAAQAAEVGMKYLICPWIGGQKTLDDYKKYADIFNEKGEICRKNGIRFAYHNHAYTFEELEGQIPQDYLMANTDDTTVDYELDLYWVVTGGADPYAYLEKYPNRFTLCHVKDRIKDAPAEEMHASCDLGTGSIDYPRLLKVAKDNGMKYFILEQERYDGSTPLKSAEAGANYLKDLVFA